MNPEDGDVFPPFADPPGYRTVNTIKYGALSQLRMEAQRIMPIRASLRVLQRRPCYPVQGE